MSVPRRHAPAVRLAPLLRRLRRSPDPRCDTATCRSRDLRARRDRAGGRAAGRGSLRFETRWPAEFSFAAGPEAGVELDGPLSFSARATLVDLPLHVPRRIAAYGIVVEPGVRAIEPETVEHGVEVTLEADARVRIRMPIGCNTLALGPATAAGYAVQDGAPTHRLVSGTPLPISATPDGAPFATVLAEDQLQLRVVARTGARARIVRALDDGVLDGWVDVSRLRPEPPGASWDDWGSSSCCGGMSGWGRGGMVGVRYEGPAVLRRGTALRGEGGVTWARATTDLPIQVIVLDDPHAPYIVSGIDGVTSHGHAWLGTEITTAPDGVVLPPGALAPSVGP